MVPAVALRTLARRQRTLRGYLQRFQTRSHNSREEL
jgi:hypothetical protein